MSRRRTALTGWEGDDFLKRAVNGDFLAIAVSIRLIVARLTGDAIRCTGPAVTRVDYIQYFRSNLIHSNVLAVEINFDLGLSQLRTVDYIAGRLKVAAPESVAKVAIAGIAIADIVGCKGYLICFCKRERANENG